MNNIAKCIGCGCTDLRACYPPCGWIQVDYSFAVGVCSNPDCDTLENHYEFDKIVSRVNRRDFLAAELRMEERAE